MRSTLMVRVPKDFWAEVEEISKSRKIEKTEFLRTDGTRIMKNARTLSGILERMKL